ncbi:hypothetical protein VTJ83DRAFT_1175 [Remersonia thermophila]|uniref:3-phytase n=1 Tax=Remersonia thermophila TaxID=72144 RepID=A0ABR4DNW7_9PEZI
MTSLVPRPPYTDDELRKLYPPGLELRQVQVLMRHGERTPISARFQNAGLRPLWPYCSAARQMRAAVLAPRDPALGPATDTLEWKRRLESIGPNDEPVLAKGPQDDPDALCDHGSLTDQGRRSTYELGQRLRHLYVDRLRFLPPALTPADAEASLYLRATPVPRALESLQQAFAALYPPSARVPGPDGRFPAPVILSRTPDNETLYPNDGNCRRLAALARAFAQRAADRWNRSPEMDLLNRRLGPWMPQGQRIAVDSRPRLSGIMDTINASLAHGPETRLPEEFYDPALKAAMEKINVDEWFSGFRESREFRMLGIGPLMGDIVGRMVERAEQGGERGIRFGLSGCHDTTLAGMLASVGAFDMERWPPFTSHVAIELFREAQEQQQQQPPPLPPQAQSAKRGWWSALFASPAAARPIGRRPTTELTQAEKRKLDGYYVRMRYNDEPVTVPACRLPGNHFEGDPSLCTLAAFKAVVDKFTPTNWKEQCRMNRDKPALPEGEPEWAGH